MEIIDRTTEYLLLILGLWYIGKVVIFYALYNASGKETPPERRSRFGKALRWVFLGLTITSVSIGALFLLRYLAGPDGVPLEPVVVALALRILLIAGLIITTIYGPKLLLAMHERRRKANEYVISAEGIFAALTVHMPIVVADSKGIIQYTTPVFDTLSGYEQGELTGRDLKVIMPERYKHRHDGGMAHYVETREPRIVGRPVKVELLRKDGTEVTVILALNTADVDGVPWFIAALWEVEPATPDTIIRDYEKERAARQDAQQVILDEASLLNAEAGLVNAERGNHLSHKFAELERGRINLATDVVLNEAQSARQDQREHEQDVRDKGTE